MCITYLSIVKSVDSIKTKTGVADCFGIHIVTLSHSKMGPDFFKELRNVPSSCSWSELCHVHLLQCLKEANCLWLWEVLCVTVFQQLRVSETASLAFCSLLATPVLWWRSYPNPQSPVELQSSILCHKSHNCRRLHILKSLAKAFKALLHLRFPHFPHSHVSSAWGLLHIESVPDGTTLCFVSPLSTISFSYASFSIMWFFSS